MLDLSYFQNSGNVNTQTFTNAGTWVTWQKPRGAKFVNILCIGAGGGGGGGIQVASGNKSGGGGGGGGGVVRAQFQASILPNILYVQTGVGGVGGVGGAAGVVTAGGSATRSIVAIIPDTGSIVVASGNAAATGGGVGSSAGSSTAGAAETVQTAANSVFLNLGTFVAVAGVIGTPGNLGNGSGYTATAITQGGTGGGGTGTGGLITGAGPIPSSNQAAAGSGANNATNGTNGVMITKPVLIFSAGVGGGGIAASGTGIGGRGGDGSWGCGGGGGGSSFVTAGNGGRGGDGLIIITTSF